MIILIIIKLIIIIILFFIAFSDLYDWNIAVKIIITIIIGYLLYIVSIDIKKIRTQYFLFQLTLKRNKRT
jgi:hypothetical protein